VKKWTKADKAFIFQLSSKTVHAFFKDGSEVVVSPVDKTVSFATKSGRITTVLLSDATEPELKKRIKYIKQC
jgi:hypothetical protein